MAGGIVPTSTHGHLKFVCPREIKSDCHIASTDTTRDHGRTAVNEGIEPAAGHVVFGIRGADDGASQRTPQLIQTLI